MEILQEAAERGLTDVVQLVVGQGVKINACYDKKTGDALFRASAMGHAPVVRFLLESGADVTSSHAESQCYSIECQKAVHTALDAALGHFPWPKGYHLSSSHLKGSIFSRVTIASCMRITRERYQTQHS